MEKIDVYEKSYLALKDIKGDLDNREHYRWKDVGNTIDDREKLKEGLQAMLYVLLQSDKPILLSSFVKFCSWRLNASNMMQGLERVKDPIDAGAIHLMICRKDAMRHNNNEYKTEEIKPIWRDIARIVLSEVHETTSDQMMKETLAKVLSLT